MWGKRGNSSPVNIGRQVIIDSYPGVGVGGLSQERELLRTDDSWTEATLWSIALDIFGTAPDQLADAPGALAHLRFGVGATVHEAYVDWRRGQRFAIHAASVQINLLLRNYTDWYTIIGNAAPPAGYPATFRATMCPDAGATVPGNVAPTCTVPVANVSEESPLVLYTIPPFARRVTVQNYSGVGPVPMEIFWYATNGNVVGRSAYSRAAPPWSVDSVSWVPANVPCEATQFAFTWVSTDFSGARAIFELAL